MRFLNRRRHHLTNNRVTESIAVRTRGLKRAVRRHRIVLVTLIAVAGVVAVLTGISFGYGNWWSGTLMQVPNAPDPRFGAATAFDEAREQVTVFGGFMGTTPVPGANAGAPNILTGPPIVPDGKIWLFRPPGPGNQTGLNNRWQTRHPIHSPSARGFAAMAYDRARKNTVLFGGTNDQTGGTHITGALNVPVNVSGDTWTWDGEDWTLQNPPKPLPDPRQNAVMFYDAHRKVVVMFGGRDGTGMIMNDTWTWDGSAWKIVPPNPALLPRHSAAVAYDECRAQAVMFGGTGPAGASGLTPQPTETWVWSGSGWTPRSPVVFPPGRIGAHMGYSPRTGNVLLYGGFTTNDAGVPTAATETDVWRWVPEDPTGVPNALTANGFWEKLHSEAGSVVDNATGFGGFDLLPFRAVPPPRAYASFAFYGVDPGFYGSNFWMFGGTPTPSISPPLISGDPNARARTTQVAYGDQFLFTDNGFAFNEEADLGSLGVQNIKPPDNPLHRKCKNPVPIPEDDPTSGAVAAPEAPKTEVRQGMEEIGQLPVLLGTDWPQANRNTHVGPNNNRTPNPSYTPPPDCPNRSNPNQSGFNATSGNNETGGNTQLATDSTRNRVYQFFVCDPNRGQGYLTPTTYYNRPEVYNLLIEVYDGTTLKPLGKAIARNVSVNSGSKTLIHDPAQDRFLVYTTTSPLELVAIQKDRVEKGLDPVGGKYTFSASDFSGKRFMNFFRHPTTGKPKLFYVLAGGGATAGSLPTVTPGPPPTVTSGSPPATSTPPKLGQWDLEGMKSDWEAPAPSACTGGSGQDTLGAVNFVGASGNVAMRSGERVYHVCHVGNSQWAVLRTSLTGNAAGSETPGTTEVFPGPYGPSGLVPWGDPQAERMIIEVFVNYEKKIWVFDGKTSRWVGRAGLGKEGFLFGFNNPIMLGFDDSAGRLYVHMADNPNGNTQGGVRIVDTRLTPVAQPVDFPQFASPAAISPAFLAGPGGARRVFIKVAWGKTKKYPNWETVEFKGEMFYRVLADNVPVPEITGLSGLDTLTLGVPETPGKTEVNFDAEGSAYGIRLRSIGGIWTAARPFQQAFSGNMDLYTEGTAMPLIRHLIPACVFPDRELMAGFVPQARLSDLDALARSSGLEVDSNSKTDLMAPTSRCNPTANASNFAPSFKGVFDALWPLKNLLEFEANQLASQGASAEAGSQSGATTEHIDTPLGTLDVFKNPAGQPTGAKAQTTSSSWDSHFKEVICVGDALKTYQASVGNIYGSSNCVQAQGLVKATAKGSALGAGSAAASPLPDGFSVGEGYSTVEVSRDKDKGVVVTARAIARGIQIPGTSAGTQNIPTLTIDRVESIAIAWSNGRAPTDEEIQTLGERTQFTRYICGVHTPDGSIPGCLSSGQQQQFVDNWNSRGGKNSQIYLPTPDPDYFNGSPGGYIAGVLKPLANAVEDELFAKDTQKEVPALEVHFYKNSQYEGDARQTLQLAAVRAIAGFGVQCDPDHLFSPQTKTCIAIPDDPLDEEFFPEDDEFFEDEEAGLEGEWIPADALLDTAESIGSKIGRLLERLPVLRRLPIREMAEALLAGSVWALLGLPLLFAWRRLVLQMP